MAVAGTKGVGRRGRSRAGSTRVVGTRRVRHTEGRRARPVASRLKPQASALWMLTDHLGSARDIVDNDGVGIAHYSYDALGNLTGDDGVILTRYLWTGREFAILTGLQYNCNRWYDPRLGRWTNEDPIGFGGGDYNLGRYATNMVTVFVDPLGLSSEVTMVSCNTTARDAGAWKAAQVLPPVAPGGMPVVLENTIYDNVQTIGDMIATLEAHVRDTKQQIDWLNISGHGSGGGISFKDRSFNSQNLTPEEVRRLRDVLAPNATVQLWACEQGNRTARVQELANLLGVRVRASTRDLTSGPDSYGLLDDYGHWLIGSPPKWKDFNPGEAPPDGNSPLPVRKEKK
jgi:RHS repeat-associated protein